MAGRRAEARRRSGRSASRENPSGTSDFAKGRVSGASSHHQAQEGSLMPQFSLRRRKGILLLTVILLAALGLTRSVKPDGGAPATAQACPPGFVSAAQQASAAARERRAEVNGVRARATESDQPSGSCRRATAPERASD